MIRSQPRLEQEVGMDHARTAFSPKCVPIFGEVAQLTNDLLASSLHGPPDTTSYRVWKLFDHVFVVVLHVKKGFSLTFLTVLQAA